MGSSFTISDPSSPTTYSDYYLLHSERYLYTYLRGAEKSTFAVVNTAMSSHGVHGPVMMPLDKKK